MKTILPREFNRRI